MKSDDQRYQHWLEHRRSTRSDPNLTDRVMASITRTSVGRPASRGVLLLMWMDRSRLRRFAACIGALLVGSVPFVYLAYISQVFIF